MFQGVDVNEWRSIREGQKSGSLRDGQLDREYMLAKLSLKMYVSGPVIFSGDILRCTLNLLKAASDPLGSIYQEEAILLTEEALARLQTDPREWQNCQHHKKMPKIQKLLSICRQSNR